MRGNDDAQNPECVFKAGARRLRRPAFHHDWRDDLEGRSDRDRDVEQPCLGVSYTKFWTDYTADFEKAHPDIHINYEQFDTETMKTKVRAALLAGTEPDIWFFNPGEFTTINHRQGKIRALNDILPVDQYTKEGRASCGDGDDMICIPLYLAPSAVYYNKALFKKAGVDPSTWANPDRPTLTEFNAAIDKLLAAGDPADRHGELGKVAVHVLLLGCAEPLWRDEGAEQRDLR